MSPGRNEHREFIYCVVSAGVFSFLMVSNKEGPTDGKKPKSDSIKTLSFYQFFHFPNILPF